MKQEKWITYAALIGDQVRAMFDPNSENYIDVQELNDEENATAFFHALFNIAPGMLYKQLIDEDLDLLDINHVANKLVFRFSKQVENTKEDEL